MDSLVSTQWLAGQIGSPDLVVLDASRHLPATGRDGRAEFLESHIPGARFFDLGSLIDETSPVPSAFPRPEQFASVLAAAGISPGDRIVFYDNSAVKTSARAWFMCRAFGLDNVAILDGGLAKWKAEGRPLESGEAIVGAAEQSRFPQPTGIRFKADMLANIESKSEEVVDARDAGRFTGEFEDTVHNLPSGHIPGSCNLHFATLFNEDGTYKSPPELEQAFRDAGIDLARPVTATCGSGVTASVLLFALHLIGHDDWALYDGSWSDWGSDPTTPKARTTE